MMQILKTQTHTQEAIRALIKRPPIQHAAIQKQVADIISAVQKYKDAAVLDYTKALHGVHLDTFLVSPAEIQEAHACVDKKTHAALTHAKANIQAFHESQLQKKTPIVQTQPGVRLWREFRPIEKVGLYVPGGLAAYPSTVLMLAIPASVAGCRKIMMTTPCNAKGKCPPATLVAADLCGVHAIYKVGGAQAIAAMALGTESIPKVHKIVGPGNCYVTAAKLLLYGQVAIDMPAGPSEILIFADPEARPDWVAADLLSQLEHSIDAQAILVTDSPTLIAQVNQAIKAQISHLQRIQMIEKSLQNSYAILVDDRDKACAIVNDYAPEHLQIVCKDAHTLLTKIHHAGSVFLGPYASEPLGDYATGANHTLPTCGFAKMFSALSVNSFGKMMQIQHVDKAGFLRLQETVQTLAQSEGLDAHKAAIAIRCKDDD